MPGVDIHAQIGASRWIMSDAASLQHALQRARFDLMGVSSRRALAGEIAAGNAEVKALLDAAPQIRGWVVVNPAYPERSAEDLRRYVSGPSWLGAVLHPEQCGQSLAAEATKDWINTYRRYTKPLLVHVCNAQAVRDLEEVATEFNTIKFIAGGAGGDYWQDCMLAAKRVVNIFLEPFSGGAHRGKLEAMFATLGPNRILFASHYPEQNPGHALGMLVDAKISDGEKQAVLTTNAVRLFNLQRPAEPEA